MTPKKSYLFLALCCALLQLNTFAQEKLPVKFGKVTPEDFNVTLTGPDSTAGAVVIADFGNSSFDGNQRGWFSLIFKHSKRIKILRRSGFDAATITIPLYTAGTETEKIESLHASTYTLEDGKVVETRLDDKSIFTDKISKNWIEKKFTFPALKEGAIIEYTYTQTSPFLFQLQPWQFQGTIPRLWSEYQVDMPNFFIYAINAQGYLPFHISKTESRRGHFFMTDPGGAGKDERFSFEDEVVTHRWVMKDVPAMKEEPFTTTIDNYIAKIEFQLSRYNFPNGINQDQMGSWYLLTGRMLREDDFGADLDKSNSWLDDTLRSVTKGATSQLEKAKRIYGYVRDNFLCTSHSNLYLSGSLKTIFKNRNGNEADLNLLLTAMLHHEKIVADPVILSTRAHGFVSPMYPLIGRYNYVISRMTIDSSEYFLDASEPWLGFGKIPNRCYNGSARIMNKDLPGEVELSADMMHEKKMTIVFLSKEEKGSALVGHVQSTPGFNEACGIRLKVKEKGVQEFTKGLQTAYTGEIGFSNLEIDSLKQPDMPLALGYDLKIAPDATNGVFYFNPLLSEGYKENPFKAAERIYPVEMPAVIDETYILNMEIPEGYDVDELPKSAKVAYNDDEGYFEYILVKDAANIQFRTRLQLRKANFKPEDYNTLREFFGFVVKKESEQIVFKKKKA